MSPSLPHLSIPLPDQITFAVIKTIVVILRAAPQQNLLFNVIKEASNTDSDSFNTTENDRTFDPDSLDQSLGPDQYTTAATSRETTPTPTNQVMNTIDMAMEALTSTLVHSTPAKRIPKATKQPAEPITPSRYNLRSRDRAGATMDSSLQETPETFDKLVKEQLGRSKRNYSKWKMAVGRQKDEYSDDE